MYQKTPEVKIHIGETYWACPDDPYDKRLQIELFQSNVIPSAIRYYFKLPENVSDDSVKTEEKQPLKSWNFYLTEKNRSISLNLF